MAAGSVDNRCDKSDEPFSWEASSTSGSDAEVEGESAVEAASAGGLGTSPPHCNSLFLEPCPDSSEDFHQLLMYIITHLQTKVIQTHAELDEVVVGLSDVAALEYPSETTIAIVSDRQACILRLVSRLYQIVCLISMDEKITPEAVYSNKDLMLHAAQRVLTTLLPTQNS